MPSSRFSLQGSDSGVAGHRGAAADARAAHGPGIERIIAAAGSARRNVRLDARLHELLRRQASLWPAGPETLANIRALAEGSAVAVVSVHEALLYAGPLSDILRAVTAVKLAGEMSRQGVLSVPCLCLSENGGYEHETHVLGLLDARGEFVELAVELIRDPEAGGFLISTRAARLALELEKLLGAPFRDAAIEPMLRETHYPGNRLAWAWAGLLSRLLREWGVIVFCPEASWTLTDLGALMPIGAVVAQPGIGDHESQRYPCRPPVHMTLADRRSLMLISRHGIAPDDFSEGPDVLVECVFPRERFRRAMEHIEQLKRDLDGGLSDLRHRLGPERAHALRLERVERRVHYQLDRLGERCAGHFERRREMLLRQFARSCNRLYPGGHPQESKLAALQILHEYGRAALYRIHEAMDLCSGQHRLVPME